MITRQPKVGDHLLTHEQYEALTGRLAEVHDAARALINSLVTMDSQTCAVSTRKFVALAEALVDPKDRTTDGE